MMIGKKGIMQTYSKFRSCLDLRHSNFQHYLDHQYHSQCKGIGQGCLSLQNSNQQLKKKVLFIMIAITYLVNSIKIHHLALDLLLLGIDIGCKGLCQHLHHSSRLHQNHNHHDYFHHHIHHHLSNQG